MGTMTWKNIERAICRRFGGERSGPVGKMGPDCINTAPFAIQCKHRKSVPQWLTDAYTQSMRDAPNGTLPLLVLHPAGWSIDESMVVINLSEFTEWYVSVGPELDYDDEARVAAFNDPFSISKKRDR